MKSPDDIKKGLECCGKGLTWDETCGMGCPYEGMYITGCSMEISADALALIRQLEERNKSLQENNDKLLALDGELHRDYLEQRERADRLEAERDALFKEVRGRCSTCKHWDKEPEEEPCASCVVLDGQCHNWQWRGVQKEE